MIKKLTGILIYILVILSIIISIIRAENWTQQNRSPTPPVITGATSGTIFILYTYSAVSTDADNNSLQYTFDFGEGASFSSEFLPNGSSYTVNHSWDAPGRYSIIVKVTDNQAVSSSKIIVYIDAVPTGPIGYLFDKDHDGTYDAFYSNVSQQITEVQKNDNTYYIDNNGDGKWDYTFNTIKGLALYQPSTTPGFESVFSLCAIVVAILLWRKKSISR